MGSIAIVAKKYSPDYHPTHHPQPMRGRFCYSQILAVTALVASTSTLRAYSFIICMIGSPKTTSRSWASVVSSALTSSSAPTLSFGVARNTTRRPTFESTPGGTLQHHDRAGSGLAGALLVRDTIGRLPGFSAAFSASLGRGAEGSKLAMRLVPGSGEV